MKIKDYKVVAGVGLNEINKNVQDAISEGWTPLGGVGVNNWTEPFNAEANVTKTQYSQAMVRYDVQS